MAWLSASRSLTAQPRPSYNTGIGAFVFNGRLYDSAGQPFRFRGTNLHDLQTNSTAAVANTQANAVRIVDSNGAINLTGTATYCATLIAQQQVPIACSAYFPDGTLTTGSTDTTEFSNLVSAWVSAFSSYSSMQKHMILNVANEWGPANSTTWRDSWITAIAALRGAGYTCPILVDTGGSGQDFNDLIFYSTAVYNSDTQKNIAFSYHVYTQAATTISANQLGQLAALSVAEGMVFVVGEFGPANGAITTTATQIINAAEQNGLGWLNWALDENGDVYQMTNVDGVYRGPAFNATDLTAYGLEVIPLIQEYASKATDFP